MSSTPGLPAILAVLCAGILSSDVSALANQTIGDQTVVVQNGTNQQVPVQPVPAAQTAPAVVPAPTRFQFGGDFRLRHESNVADAEGRNHDRIVIRGRARAVFNASTRVAVGVQVTTGDPDDPNSADVTLSNFDDDLQISLDQLYARLQFRDVQFVAGKVPQPLTRTDLLWDADVSPQGVSATYATQFPWATSLKTTALYFVIDESLTGRNSDMAGLQVAWNYPAASAWRYELAVGYYDYSLRSVVGADAGDFRSNAIDETGNYVSDFNLLNIIGGVTYQGVGLRWPVRVTTDYVRNFGAAISADTAYSADVVIGRLSTAKDWRYGYGYSTADTDAVLAAFSHDNTTIATNYRQHSAALDYQLASKVFVNATLYRYRPKNPSETLSDVWLNRLRLNLLISF